MHAAHHPPWQPQHGFTLIEAVLAMMIVAVLLLATMRVAGASALIQYKTAERLTARNLADGLIYDLIALPYQDPDSTAVFGRETGESSTSKANWDDVDDFNGWSESPPQQRDGTIMSDLPGWQRSVVVERVNPLNPSQVLNSETGAKRITVTVRRNGVVVSTRQVIRGIAPT